MKRSSLVRRMPGRSISRLRAKNKEQADTIKMLQEEFGSLLDLVPLVDLADGADDETIRWMMGGTFLPHLAQLMASTLLAFDAANVCEWTLAGDPRGEFVLTIQRKGGKTPAALRGEALDKARVMQTRLVELIRVIGAAFDAYMDTTGTLVQLLDVIHREMQTAQAPLGLAIADINAAAWNRLRHDSANYADLAPELLPNIVGGLLDERRAARSVLDRQEIKAAMLQAPHFRDLYMAYTQLRGAYDHSDRNTQAGQEAQDQGTGAHDPAAQAGS